MPRYFFDVDDGERQTCDEEGICLPGLDDVEREARVLLENLSVPEVLGGRDRIFTALVRDQGGKVVYKGMATHKIDRDTIIRWCDILRMLRHRSHRLSTPWHEAIEENQRPYLGGRRCGDAPVLFRRA